MGVSKKDFSVKRNVFEKVYWSFIDGGVKKILQGERTAAFRSKTFYCESQIYFHLVFFLMLFIHTQITN